MNPCCAKGGGRNGGILAQLLGALKDRGLDSARNWQPQIMSTHGQIGLKEASGIQIYAMHNSPLAEKLFECIIKKDLA